MVMHSEAESREKAPPLVGIDRVLKENLYGNLRFPQVGFAIFAHTLYALVTDPNPKKMIVEYLTSDPTEEQLDSMLGKANRAHAAYLREEKIPILNTERMRELWGAEREFIQSFFAGLLHIPTGRNEITGIKLNEEELLEAVLRALGEKEISLETLKVCSGIIVATLKEPSIAEELKEYRELFRENEATSTATVKAQGDITRQVLARMIETVADDAHIDTETLQAFCRVVSREL